MTPVDYILIGLYYIAWYGAPIAAVIGVYRVLTADWQPADGDDIYRNRAEEQYRLSNWAWYGQSTVPYDHYER